MKWNDHKKYIGQHAFLGGSRYTWISYDEERLLKAYENYNAAEEGTELHELAAQLIKKHRKQAGRDSFARYVNDAIGFRMTPEVILWYSDIAYGSADTISFRKIGDRNVLRIHDYKSGKVHAGDMRQLMIYAALFCLEYHYDPESIDVILRIYQFNDIAECIPDPQDIRNIMEKAVKFTDIIHKRMDEDSQ